MTVGSYKEETELHHRFAHLHIGGEWHRPEPELMAFIAENARPWDGSDEGRTYGPAKLDVEVIALAKKAASMQDKTLADYLSDLVRDHAPYDIQEGAARIVPTEPKPPRRTRRD